MQAWHAPLQTMVREYNALTDVQPELDVFHESRKHYGELVTKALIRSILDYWSPIYGLAPLSHISLLTLSRMLPYAFALARFALVHN